MAQSDARFGYKANLNREDHDLSQKFGFSTYPGALCPIWYDFATPGDSYYMKHDLSFLRTGPLASPAMIDNDVTVHYETFFVPIQVIYQPAENSFFSLNNIQSSHYDQSQFMNANFPLFDYRYYVSQMCANHTTSKSRTLAFRLADFLDMQGLNFAQPDVTLDANNEYLANPWASWSYYPSHFPYKLLAYHAIFEYYYRLDDKSQFNNALYNFDQFYNQSTPIQSTWVDYMTIHQRPWDFDYFTSIYRSPIVSDANMQTLTSFIPDLFQGSTTTVQPVNSQGLPVSSGANGGNSAMVATVGNFAATFNRDILRTATSTAYIRQMFADEKLTMITGRARKNYDSQVLAHYGVKVPHDPKHDISLVHANHYSVKVGEVISLASTEKSDGSPLSSLGDMAGKGYSSGTGDKFKFTAPCHGVLMTIFSIEPIKRYFAGFNRDNAITSSFDFPVPEFDRLGNMPMYQYEAGTINTLGQTWSSIVGWKERYYQFKRRKPRVTVGFMELLSTPSDPKFNDWETFFISSWAFGAKHATNFSRPDLEERFYIDPACMDNLMLVHQNLAWHDGSTQFSGEDWNTHPNLAYVRDPFIVDSWIKCKKVSWMSKDGEPVYPY